VLCAVQLGAAGDFVAGVGGDEGGFGGFLGGRGGDGGGGHGEWRGGGWTGVWGGRSEGGKVGKVGRLSVGIGSETRGKDFGKLALSQRLSPLDLIFRSPTSDGHLSVTTSLTSGKLPSLTVNEHSY